MRRTPLYITIFALAAGAFGFFFRWLQLQIAFNEFGLVNRSGLNVLVVLSVLAVAWLYRRMIRDYMDIPSFLPDEMERSLRNTGKLYTVARWSLGGLMCLGALALLYKTYSDPTAGFLPALAVAGGLTGLAVPLLLDEANRPIVIEEPESVESESEEEKKKGKKRRKKKKRLTKEERRALWKRRWQKLRPAWRCLLATVPVAFLSLWLLTEYQLNSINPVIWSYLVETVTIAVLLMAFFRIAGVPFGQPRPARALFDCLLGSYLCFMSISDERHTGQTVMLVAMGLMLILYANIMVSNLVKGKKPKEREKDDHGFETLM